jgi:hypothetical protein
MGPNNPSMALSWIPEFQAASRSLQMPDPSVSVLSRRSLDLPGVAPTPSPCRCRRRHVMWDPHRRRRRESVPMR